MGCNESKVLVTDSDVLNGFDVEWYLSEQEINDIEAAGAAGGTAAGFYQWLVSRGILSLTLPSPVGITLAVVAGLFWAWVKWSNSGCGVIIHVYISYQGDFQAVYVESQ